MDRPQLEIYSTYIWVILMVASVVTIAFYSSLTTQTLFITVPTPSLSTFETLQKTYSKTLNCPCSEPAIYHMNMLTFPDPVYHQVKS